VTPSGALTGQAMRALLIDDSPDYLLLLQRYLARELAGVEVTCYLPAEHGGAVPDLAAQGADVILLDYELNEDQDGLGWLQALRAQADCPPVIFMTAHGDEYVAVRAIKGGAADYVNKRDISSARLADVIRAVLVGRGEVDWDLEGDAGARTDDAGDQDGYRFLRPIGAGNMSKVYLAERMRDGLSLALKVIDLKNLQTEEVRQRFLQEAELASSIDSPYVVRIYDFGFTPTYGYMAMELFTRGDLKQRLRHGVKLEDAALYLWNIAQGLAVIHDVGIVHRDLKPDNIMFRSDDSMALADFGISKRLVEQTQMTTVGKVLGTPHYMSPEQGQGLPVGPPSDLYAAGVIFFEMLTGRHPFDAPDPLSLIHRHVTAPIPRLPHRLQRFQPIIQSTLAKKPEQRFPDAAALVDALEPHVQ
jgi:DNA-binding response OmpR family regulator